LVEPVNLSTRLRDAARTAREIDLRPYETKGSNQVREKILPQLIEAVDRGIRALGEVLAHYEQLPSAPSELADLSFMARMELLSHRQQLDGVAGESDALSILSVCGASRRSLLRSTFVVDRALCEREGLAFEPADLGAFELKLGLRVRAEYARFRRDVLMLGAPELTGIVTYLERAAKRLGELVSGELFDEFRLDDRLMMHRLRARLGVWLDGRDGREVKSGLRLAQDLAGFTSLLVQVNHRTELVEHDRALVKEIYAALFEGKPRTSVPPEVQAKLWALYGRDEGVDGLLDAGLGMFAVEWREPLERLQASLGLSDAAPEGPAEGEPGF